MQAGTGISILKKTIKNEINYCVYYIDGCEARHMACVDGLVVVISQAQSKL